MNRFLHNMLDMLIRSFHLHTSITVARFVGSALRELGLNQRRGVLNSGSSTAIVEDFRRNMAIPKDIFPSRVADLSLEHHLFLLVAHVIDKL